MDKIIIKNINEIETKEKIYNNKYGYRKRSFISRKDKQNSVVSIYTIPPKMAGYPYHYHLMNEETFYIIKGTGLLQTEDGEKRVKEGDLIFFPPTLSGAHKLVNDSLKQELVYLDFDTNNPIDVSIYPDSEKIAIWGKDTNKIFKINDKKDYYDGE